MGGRAHRSRSTSDRLLARAREADYTVLIAPETMSILEELTRGLPGRGARPLGRSPEAVALAGDKRRLAGWLADRGIDTPPCRRVDTSGGSPRRCRLSGGPQADRWGRFASTRSSCEDAERIPPAARDMAEAILQPYVSGRPMSASFLVEGDGRAWLLGIGEQHIMVQRRSLRLPRRTPCRSPRRVDEAPMRAAVESVPGLRGFVGVDFIWDEGRRRTTVLEINPRPTTSIVGMTRFLPPGRLASAWIGAFDPDYRGADLLAGLRGPRSAHPPVTFDASGAIGAAGGDRMSSTFRGLPVPLDRPGYRRGQHQGRACRRPRATVPFEVWKRPDELSRAIASVAATLPPSSGAAVTMTAELCDCYPTKTVGVHAVLDAVSRPCPSTGSSSGGWTAIFTALRPAERPMLAAAANWLALAELAARLVPDDPAILIDIGTTTTDLIPLDRGAVAARGRSDTERLQSGELVYAGVRRTPVHALATELPFRGVPTGLAAELFASTLDVYLVLGDLATNPLDISTADGRPATAEAARDRLARMIGSDRDGFSDADALAMARAADSCLLERLERAAERACHATIGRPDAAVIAGSGDFLARRLARRLVGRDRPVISLNEAWGPVASAAACALRRSSTLRPNVSTWRIGWLDLPAPHRSGRRTPRELESSDPRQGRRQPARLARAT